MGSDVFMRELRATESSVPWRSRTSERVHLYLDQFGSFRAEPDRTGAVLKAVQRGAKASLRVAILLDEESDEDAPSAPAEVLRVKEIEHAPKSVLEEMPSPEKDDDREGGGGSCGRIRGCWQEGCFYGSPE